MLIKVLNLVVTLDSAIILGHFIRFIVSMSIFIRHFVVINLELTNCLISIRFVTIIKNCSCLTFFSVIIIESQSFI